MTESKTFKAVASSTWKVCEHKQGWRVTFKIFLFYRKVYICSIVEQLLILENTIK